MNQKSKLVILGGGILGTSLAYWLSTLYKEDQILLIEQEKEIALHSSGRNSGIIHRPFYLDPKTKYIFALCAQFSYFLWKKYSQAYCLPWNSTGTLKLALKEKDIPLLKKYQQWAIENGMNEDEIELLLEKDLKNVEKEIRAVGALWCKTDTAVHFGQYTQSLKENAKKNGVQFLFKKKIVNIKIKKGSISLISKDGEEIETSFFINCAGGEALHIAHLCGLAKEYTNLHFRGTYWKVDQKFSSLATRNLYTLPKNPEFPFLDPHWLIRWDGSVEIGPTALPILGPYIYQGFFPANGEWAEAFKKIIEKPIRKLFGSKKFLTLALEEWKSVFFKDFLAKQVQSFLPKFQKHFLSQKGISGIRSPLICEDGTFLPDTLSLFGPFSFHILNYNSPGATGAPFYTAMIMKTLQDKEILKDIEKREKPKEGPWNFFEIEPHIPSLFSMEKR